jgi:hypothetical protein
MGILVIVIMIIIIHHRLNFMNFCLFVFCYLACTLSMILSICILLFVLHSFNDFVYLYFVVCIALFQWFCLFVFCCLYCTLSVILSICFCCLYCILSMFSFFYLFVFCCELFFKKVNQTFVSILLANEECKKIINETKWHPVKKEKNYLKKLLYRHKII